MPTVVIEDGYRLKIYINDHAPSHVHIEKAEHEARVALDTLDVLSNEGFNQRELTKIRQMVQKHHELLASVWNSYH